MCSFNPSYDSLLAIALDVANIVLKNKTKINLAAECNIAFTVQKKKVDRHSSQNVRVRLLCVLYVNIVLLQYSSV